MFQRSPRGLVIAAFLLFMASQLTPPAAAQKKCFSPEERAKAERKARVYRAPDPGYDPVLGYNPQRGPRKGSPPVNSDGVARPVICAANKDETPGAGTTPKFH